MYKMLKYGLLFASLWSFAFGQSQYQIGVGISDCTGPAAEVNMVNIFVTLFKCQQWVIEFEF